GREETEPALGPSPRAPAPREQERRLAFHPVIVGDQALVTDARSVRAFDLRTGAASVWYDLAQANKVREDDVSATLPALADVSYTLTVAADRAYVRLGTQQLGPPKE